MSESIKLLTYNIHKGFNVGNRDFTLRGIKKAIESVGANVVVLQEVIGHHDKYQDLFQQWPGKAHVGYLADNLWPHSAYGKNAIYKSGHHGNAILSQHAFIQWENIDVSFLKSASRSLLHGVIKIEDNTQPIHIICVHLGLFSIERKRQISMLMDRIQRHVPDNEPLIIAGDFNDWRVQVDGYFKNQLHVKDVFKATHGKFAKTFPAWLPMLSMDRIYTRGIEIKHCKILSGQPWRKLSDHLPLLAEFEIA
jgi:endonuclease/exonuclease/phosphatase family metal-dependent hydrolase